MVTITLYAKQKKRHRCIEQILDSVGEGEGGMFQENSFETCILSRVKQITSPGWMEGEVGEGIRMRNTCKSMADSFQCMTKPTTIL